MQKVKITHIITGLDMGGAEAMLYKLLKHMDQEVYDINVISMMGDGVYGSKIKKMGFKVTTLNMKQGKPSVKAFLKARQVIKNTDIIQTWMYHADLFGYLLYKTTKVRKLIWGIRRNNLDLNINKKSTLLIAKINSMLSKNVDTIVSCSRKAKTTHVNFGFNNQNMKVIPNGFELEQFKFHSKGKLKLGNLLNKPLDIPFIIHVGRWNVLKDHKNFLKALTLVKENGLKFHVAMVGSRVNEQNNELVNLIREYNLLEYISLLDQRNDISILMSGADLFVSSSIDEGFPNVIGEAMACQTPCVVTDAGDSAYLVGETGIIVPPKDAKSLANGIIQFLNYTAEKRRKKGLQARRRIVENFDIKKVVDLYEDLYKI